MNDAQLPNCTRSGCGHPADWHRLDDSKGLGPGDPGAEFRCVGYDCTAPGPIGSCAVACPDYASEV